MKIFIAVACGILLLLALLFTGLSHIYVKKSPEQHFAASAKSEPALEALMSTFSVVATKDKAVEEERIVTEFTSTEMHLKLDRVSMSIPREFHFKIRNQKCLNGAISEEKYLVSLLESSLKQNSTLKIENAEVSLFLQTYQFLYAASHLSNFDTDCAESSDLVLKLSASRENGIDMSVQLANQAAVDNIMAVSKNELLQSLQSLAKTSVIFTQKEAEAFLICLFKCENRLITESNLPEIMNSFEDGENQNQISQRKRRRRNANAPTLFDVTFDNQNYRLSHNFLGALISSVVSSITQKDKKCDFKYIMDYVKDRRNKQIIGK